MFFDLKAKFNYRSLVAEIEGCTGANLQNCFSQGILELVRTMMADNPRKRPTTDQLIEKLVSLKNSQPDRMHHNALEEIFDTSQYQWE